MRTWVALVIVIAACGRSDRPFTTLATYDAPKSGFRLFIDASGVVPADEDLMPVGVLTTAIVCPTTAAGHALRIDVTNPAAATVTNGIASSGMRWAVGELERALDDAHYPPLDHAEIEEAFGSINGVAGGPKGTRMPGQTHHITVVKIDFTKHAPLSVKACL